MSTGLRVRKEAVTVTQALSGVKEEGRRASFLQAVPLTQSEHSLEEQAVRLLAKVKDLEKQLFGAKRLLKQKEALLRNAGTREMELRAQMSQLMNK